MTDDANDLAAVRVNRFDDDVRMNRQRAFQPSLERRGLGPVLAEPWAGGQKTKDRAPVGVRRLDHRLGDKAVVDQLVVEGFLTARAQLARGSQGPNRADRQR